MIPLSIMSGHAEKKDKIKIAILDDDREFLTHFSDSVDEYCADAGVLCALFRFTSAAEFWSAFSPGAFDIVFLDIVLPEESGLDLARRIFERDKKCLIVYITASPDYAMSGYGVGAVGYLLKPLGEEALRRVMDDCVARVRAREGDFVWVRVGNILKRLDPKRVLYLESSNKCVRIHCDDETIECSGKICDIREKFSLPLVRVHQSYVVHMGRVVGVSADSVHMEGGGVVPVSRRYRRDIHERHLRLAADEI